jgi:NDP-sugar pyrophosphorylase family protein
MIKNSALPVVILAGGLATRLRPVTKTIPKALIKINDKPFIAHQLNLLRDKGIKRVVVCVGFLGEQIEAFVGDGSQFNLDVSYAYDGEKLLGTAGAIKKALPLLGDAFFVIYGDSYLACDYLAVQRDFMRSKKLALMTVFNNNGLWDASNVEFTDGKLMAYNKTQRTKNMHYIDYGLGIFKATAFATVLAQQPYDLACLYQQLLRDDKLLGYEIKQRFYEIGSLAGQQELAEYLNSQN